MTITQFKFTKNVQSFLFSNEHSSAFNIQHKLRAHGKDMYMQNTYVVKERKGKYTDKLIPVHHKTQHTNPLPINHSEKYGMQHPITNTHFPSCSQYRLRLVHNMTLARALRHKSSECQECHIMNHSSISERHKHRVTMDYSAGQSCVQELLAECPPNQIAAKFRVTDKWIFIETQE